MKNHKLFGSLIICLLSSQLLFTGCAGKIIKEKMNSSKKLLAEMETMTQSSENEQSSIDEKSAERVRASIRNIKGETFTDIFDMLDYEDVLFTLSDDGKTITITNNKPIKNNYILRGETLLAGARNFRLTYNPEENQIIDSSKQQ